MTVILLRSTTGWRRWSELWTRPRRRFLVRRPNGERSRESWRTWSPRTRPRRGRSSTWRTSSGRFFPDKLSSAILLFVRFYFNFIRASDCFDDAEVVQRRKERLKAYNCKCIYLKEQLLRFFLCWKGIIPYFTNVRFSWLSWTFWLYLRTRAQWTLIV